MVQQKFRELLDKYLTNAITESEKNELFRMIRSSKHFPELQEVVEQQLGAGDFEGPENEELRQLIFQNIQQTKGTGAGQQMGRLRYFEWRRIAVAAAVILIIAGGYWLLRNKNEKKPAAPVVTQSFQNDIQPGTFKAKLMLANGQTVVLNGAAAGELAKQGNARVLNKNNQLVYQTTDGATSEVLYNTLSTARGETYAMMLADRSIVWLNSASSIKFPVVFVGNERRVEIKGEAYFTVRHDDRKPFHVVANGIEIEDLGTEFDVNAYSDEVTIKTTLVSGKVRVVKGKGQHLISPGQQLQVTGDEMKLVPDADVQEATAWKNGFFRFKGADVGTVMRQLARWYDVDVVYEGKIPGGHLSGIVNRNASLVEVLKMLELSDIHFRVDGKKVIVM